MSDTPTETDLARDALQSELNDLDVSGALVHAVEMFVEAKIREMRRTVKVDGGIPLDIATVAVDAAIRIDEECCGDGPNSGVSLDDTVEIIARAILAEREACAKIVDVWHKDSQAAYEMTSGGDSLAKQFAINAANYAAIASSIRNRQDADGRNLYRTAR